MKSFFKISKNKVRFYLYIFPWDNILDGFCLQWLKEYLIPDLKSVRSWKSSRLLVFWFQRVWTKWIVQIPFFVALRNRSKISIVLWYWTEKYKWVKITVAWFLLNFFFRNFIAFWTSSGRCRSNLYRSVLCFVMLRIP